MHVERHLTEEDQALQLRNTLLILPTTTVEMNPRPVPRARSDSMINVASHLPRKDPKDISLEVTDTDMVTDIEYQTRMFLDPRM